MSVFLIDYYSASRQLISRTTINANSIIDAKLLATVAVPVNTKYIEVLDTKENLLAFRKDTNWIEL